MWGGAHTSEHQWSEQTWKPDGGLCCHGIREECKVGKEQCSLSTRKCFVQLLPGIPPTKKYCMQHNHKEQKIWPPTALCTIMANKAWKDPDFVFSWGMSIWNENCRDSPSSPSAQGAPFGKTCVLGYAECFDLRNWACDCHCIVRAIFSCSAVSADTIGNPKEPRMLYLINHSICEPDWFFWMQLDLQLIDYWSTQCQTISYVFITSSCC